MEQSKFYQIKNVTECEYTLVGCDGSVITRPIQEVDKIASSFTIQDAKDGDVLTSDYEGGICTALLKNVLSISEIEMYCHLINDDLFIPKFGYSNAIWHPATNEQRDTLFAKMKEAGYVWDAEKKELKKIEEEVNGEDYGIDSLYHAQRILEKTLGKVDGYQSDDGILEHKCAITAVKKLYKQKHYGQRQECADCQFNYAGECKGSCAMKRNEQKPITCSDGTIDSSYEGIINAAIYWGKEAPTENGIIPEDKVKGAVDYYCSLLKNNDGWSEEDEESLLDLIKFIENWKVKGKDSTAKLVLWTSDEQKCDRLLTFLKSLRPQNTWKPSDEQMDALKEACDEHWEPDGLDPLYTLYQDLKKLKREYL